MKNFTIISAITLLLFVPNIFPQTVAPLNLGNIWVYDEIGRFSRTTVVDTSIYFGSVSYYKLFYEDNYGILKFYFHARLREDGFYVRFSEFDSTETAYYKKNAVLGDTWTVGTLVYTIEDTTIANVFGEPTTIKLLTVDDGLIYRQEFWTEKFGKLGSQDFGGVLDDLQGCVIDGIAYGDTTFTIVSVEDETELPNSFYLAQNYPNPFNPSTTINFYLSGSDFVSIEVFNVVGEKVKTLVNEFKPAGTHTIQFEADGLASGTYLYVLKTTNYTQAKKMQLIK